MNSDSAYAAVEYRGKSGITSYCLDALVEVLQSHPDLDKVTVITMPTDGGCARHGLLLAATNSPTTPSFVVRDGFGSGYPGEGPSGFSFALASLGARDFECGESVVTEVIFKKVAGSGLTNGDIKSILSKEQTGYWQIEKYIQHRHDGVAEADLWRRLSPTLPLALIDPRLLDLVKVFRLDPDAALSRGYKRLEDIVRTRTGLDSHGAKLFQQAFNRDEPKLVWKDHREETAGLLQLFTGTYIAFRNPRAHKEGHRNDEVTLAQEFLQLNQLFVLESEAVVPDEAWFLANQQKK